MSTYHGDGYDDEPRRYRNVQTRPRDRGEPDYVREETYIERGKGPMPRDMMPYRGREDSVEEISRDFPPPGSRSGHRHSSARSEYDDYGPPPRRARSVGRRYSDDYDDDRSTHYGTAAGGAAAGYAAGRRGKSRDRRSRRDRDYESDYSDSPPPRKDKERRKSGVEELLGGLGLGGIAGALSGKKDKDKDDDARSTKSGRSGRSRSRVSRRRDSSDSRSSSRGTRGPDKKRNTEKKWAQAAQAALITGAIEAFRSRKEPGPWTGEKGKRIATAAIGAGGIDGLLDRNPNEKTKRHLAEAVVGGLAANRLANGPRSKSRGRDRDPDDDRSISPDARPRSRSRSIIDRFRGRSQSRGRAASDAGGDKGGGGTLKNLAMGGAAAAAGKALYDRYRSKSRKGNSRDRDSSADSYVPSRNRRRGRGGSQRSDTGDTRRSVAETGRDRSRGLGFRDTNGGNSNNNRALVSAGAGGAGGAAGALAMSRDQDKDQHEPHPLDSSDESSTTDMEKKRKHMRGKELLTAGLATIATIHAAHGVYSSMESHEKRHKMVAEGEMTPEEARKKQTKAWVQDAAAVGIAALGIKGAFSEWKEMKEHRYISPILSFSLPNRAGLG